MKETLTNSCSSKPINQSPKLIALTGGPGAGKTAVLELARRNFCKHVAVLPESAGIVFGGGFPRQNLKSSQVAAQIAIYHVQRQLEQLYIDTQNFQVILCDRGTLDGLAYWPDTDYLFWEQLSTTKDKQLQRYAAVIHLRTPDLHLGYNHSNPIRIESPKEASMIDSKIFQAWEGHCNRHIIENSQNFVSKASEAIRAIITEMPSCCNTMIESKAELQSP